MPSWNYIMSISLWFTNAALQWKSEMGKSKLVEP